MCELGTGVQIGYSYGFECKNTQVVSDWLQLRYMDVPSVFVDANICIQNKTLVSMMLTLKLSSWIVLVQELLVWVVDLRSGHQQPSRIHPRGRLH